ncbi:hypothetical protein FJTKL_03261 [Diaporthe vaccinii]|uniref:SnoaL-like domain-containing protein n=1 Tax=Diaporthe vaccinii TaxID=105482 RepID=A0ABR4DWJ8_9PEZI
MQSFLILSQAFLAMASFPSPIPFPSLASLFAPDADLSPPDPIAESQIRNTLATYTFSIDSKNFTALSSVFHPDAVANYSEPINVISGLSEITATLEASLARSIAMAEGQVLYAYGQYQDLLTPSEQGTWLITERNLVYMGPFVGNLSAFVGTG